MDAAMSADEAAGAGAGAAMAAFVESLISLQVLKRLLSLLVLSRRSEIFQTVCARLSWLCM